MKAAAAHGLASLIDERELAPDFIIASVFDRRVAPAISRAVQQAVEQTGLSRLSSRLTSDPDPG
jgi:malate dehydrogenase (oxaloacetate-decarboxylating)